MTHLYNDNGATSLKTPHHKAVFKNKDTNKKELERLSGYGAILYKNLKKKIKLKTIGTITQIDHRGQRYL